MLLKAFSCPNFKVLFHLWNETGLKLAKASVIADYQWVQIRSKRSEKSYADATNKLNLQVPVVRGNPLSGTNLVRIGNVFNHSSGRRLVFSRLHFRVTPIPCFKPGFTPSFIMLLRRTQVLR
jgi:hypothetical protein